jgi:hypothetical protein
LFKPLSRLFWLRSHFSQLLFILSGMQIFHNYIRPHQALKDKTPAEVAGIKVEGDNKWMTLIQNATKEKRSQAPSDRKE